MKTVQQFLVVFWRERERTPWSQPVDEAGIKIQEEERNLSVSWEANIRARGKRVISKQQEGAFFYILWPARWAHPPAELKSRAGNHTLNPPSQIRIRKVQNKEQYPTHSTAQRQQPRTKQ
jgi:hypothetical protein